MWIFTTHSFVSAVACRDDKNMISVRGRVKGDVLRFLEPVAAENSFSELEAAGTDYAVRCIVPKKIFLEALMFWANLVDYTNFKNAVPEQARHDAYMGVWHVMHTLQKFCNPIDFTKRILRKGNSINSRTLGF